MNTQDIIPSGITLRCELGESRNPFRSIAWTPEGKILAAGSMDQTIRLWDTQTWQEMRTLEGILVLLTLFLLIAAVVFWPPKDMIFVYGT